MDSNPSLNIEGIGEAICSVECLQDIEFQVRMFRQFRTTEITKQEIADWKEIYSRFDGPAHRGPILTGEITSQEIEEWGIEYKKFKKIDFAEVKKRYSIKFESDEEPPYQEYDFRQCTRADQQMLL